jgi:hypothetical protein
VGAVWWIFNWRYNDRLSSKDAEIALLTRQRDDARERLGGASPDRTQVGAATIHAGAAQLYIGGDPWSDPFAPTVYAKLPLWATPQAMRIHNMFARLESGTHRQDFRLWNIIDWGKGTPKTQKTALDILTTIVDLGHYFYLDEETWRTYKFVLGNYTLTLTAFTDDGKNFEVKIAKFTLTKEHIDHMQAKQGVYFNWDATESKYRPLLSAHVR